MTVQEWLERLPNGYRQLAIKYAKEENKSNLRHREYCMSDALMQAFAWNDTPHGYEYWDRICNYFDIVEAEEWTLLEEERIEESRKRGEERQKDNAQKKKRSAKK